MCIVCIVFIVCELVYCVYCVLCVLCIVCINSVLVFHTCGNWIIAPLIPMSNVIQSKSESISVKNEGNTAVNQSSKEHFEDSISLSIQGHELSNFVRSLRIKRSWMSDCQKKMESGKFTESSDFYREHLPTLSKTSENGNLKSCRKSLQLTFFRWWWSELIVCDLSLRMCTSDDQWSVEKRPRSVSRNQMISGLSNCCRVWTSDLVIRQYRSSDSISKSAQSD